MGPDNPDPTLWGLVGAWREGVSFDVISDPARILKSFLVFYARQELKRSDVISCGVGDGSKITSA